MRKVTLQRAACPASVAPACASVLDSSVSALLCGTVWSWLPHLAFVPHAFWREMHGAAWPFLNSLQRTRAVSVPALAVLYDSRMVLLSRSSDCR
jgi:hypothetical protein